MIRKYQPDARVLAPKPARRDKPQMTLDRVLSRAGVASRTVAADLIAAGRVSVDGRILRDAAAWVEPARQKVALDGQRLARPRPLYFALNKPTGVITSHGDPEGRKTIYDILPPATPWLFPVGRLDQDTSGLLLLTNDSIFAERIANPTSHVAKTYQLKVNAKLTPEQLDRLRAGLDIGRDERSGPAKVTWLRENVRFCWIELEIHEGKNRQVRRMIEALGHKVLKLTRIRIGKLQLGDLPIGQIRPIRPQDVVSGSEK